MQEAKQADAQIQQLLNQRDRDLPETLFTVFPEWKESSNNDIMDGLQKLQQNANIGTIFLNVFPQFKGSTSDQLQHLMEALAKLADRRNSSNSRSSSSVNVIQNEGKSDAEIAAESVPSHTATVNNTRSTRSMSGQGTQIDFPKANSSAEKSGQHAGLSEEDKRRATEAINQKFDEMGGTNGYVDSTDDDDEDDSESGKKRHSLFDKIVGK